MNKISLILVFIFGIVTVSNSQTTMLYVNNSIDNPNAIELRIFTPDFKNKDGFYIYRKSGNSSWQKLNEQALTQKKSGDLGPDVDENTKKILDLLNSDENTGEGLIMLVLATYIIQDKTLADATGTRYIDKNLTGGISYTYKVTNAKTGKEIAVSKPFTKGKYSPMPPPDSLKVYQEGNKFIDFEWKAVPLQFYGINIYRAVNSQEAKKINEKPIFLTRIKDENGIEKWPKIKYSDEDLKIGNQYSYQIEALDYFGNPGQLSEPFVIDFKDIEPPVPTKGLFARIDDKAMRIDLSWRKNSAKDLLGYDVFYSKFNDTNKTAINITLLPPDSLSVGFKVDESGKYNVWVEASDSAGNVSKSESYSFIVLDKQPPEIPHNLSYELLGKGKVKLSWQSEKGDDFMTYRIYRKEIHARHFVLITADDFDSTFFMDHIDLSVKNAFQYYVMAIDTLFNKSEKSEILVVKLPDITPPGKPFLKNVSLSNDSIIIVWRENKDDDLAGYNVYFYNENDTTKINSQLIANKKYVDLIIHNEDVLKYIITAVDSSGNESEFSNSFLLKKAYKSMADGDFAKIKVKAKKGSREVNISWKFKEENPPVGFVIYRAEAQGKFKPISGMTKETQFKDKVSKPGTYKYKVTAIYSSGDKLNSEIKEITINE